MDRPLEGLFFLALNAMNLFVSSDSMTLFLFLPRLLGRLRSEHFIYWDLNYSPDTPLPQYLSHFFYDFNSLFI